MYLKARNRKIISATIRRNPKNINFWYKNDVYILKYILQYAVPSKIKKENDNT